MEFKKIPLEQIHVRHPMHIKKTPQGYREHVESIVDSIAVLGLIQPIAVYQDSEQEYFVIDGAKRLQACQWFNQKFPEKELAAVECVIHTNIEDEFEKEKIIHTSMRVGTTPLSQPDISVSMSRLWNTYQDMTLFEHTFGISKYFVQRYARYLLLPELLKEAIVDGSIHYSSRIATDIAVKSMHALNWTADNDVSDEYVLKLAKAYAKSSENPRRRDTF